MHEQFVYSIIKDIIFFYIGKKGKWTEKGINKHQNPNGGDYNIMRGNEFPLYI